MSSVSRFLLVSALFSAQSLVACGGSSDLPKSSASGGQAGADHAGSSAGTSAHRAGAGPVDAGGSSALGGAPASAGQSTGGAPHSDTGSEGGTKLSQIKTNAQALVVCNRIKDAFSDAELMQIVAGACAIEAQSEAESEQGTCEELQAECVEKTPLPSTDDGSCTAEDLPACDDVSVDEYVACSQAVMAARLELLSGISCDTDLQTLEEPGTPKVCRGPFARCPEFAEFFE